MPSKSNREKKREQKKTPASDVPAESPKPANERNSDQGKLQESHDSQRRERGTHEGNEPPTRGL